MANLLGRATLTAVAIAAGVVLLPASATLAAGPESVSHIAAGLLDSVVNISTSQTVTGSRRGVPSPRVPDGSPFQEFFDEFFSRRNESPARPRRVQSMGSGFVIDSGGIIVTNNHVIEDADEITAIFNDGTSMKATLIGADDKIDIAVLKVEPEDPLAAVSFGHSDELRVGDWVMAIGNPFGLGGSVTLGIVSARNRDINSGPYDNFIQTDAAINRGNSGGPLFNMDGEVVGINTAIISPTGGSIGIGFAVPAQTAIVVIDQLRQFGETRRGWLGVRIQPVTDIMAQGLQLSEARGALVAGVTVDGPAEEAGIAAGDVILEFDGERVTRDSELPRMVAYKAIGIQVDVLVLRGGEELVIPVVLGRLEDSQQLASVATDDLVDEPVTNVINGPFGLKLADLTDDLRNEFKIDHQIDGVVVTDVEEGGAADEKRFRRGDVIVEIAQERVEAATNVEERIEALKAEGRGSALFLLANKAGDLRFVAVKLD